LWNSDWTWTDMENVFFSIGSNMGDRRSALDKAVELLDQKLGGSRLAVSDYIETPSWGFDAPDFLNAVVAYGIEDPDGLKILDICKEIEAEMGRKENVEYDDNGQRIYHSRPIDIDILLIGDRKINEERLTVPHPLMEKRDFVMIPLAQVKEKLNF